MRLQFISKFDKKRVKGYFVTVDKIRYDSSFAGRFAVRVVGEWSRPCWLAITWFVEVPHEGL